MESKKIQFKNGILDGLPIGLGYLPISFSFGMLGMLGKVPPIVVLMMSMTCFTSSGQFAALNIMMAGGTYVELVAATLVINIRYMLMTLGLSQKIEKMSFVKRLAISFGITDEVFAVAAMKPHKVTYTYMTGLIALPYIGWISGTVLGIIISDLLPPVIAAAMGISLYAMFLAIILTPARHEKSIFTVVLVSAVFSCLLYYIPLFGIISDSWKMIISSVIAAALGATFFPHKEDNTQ